MSLWLGCCPLSTSTKISSGIHIIKFDCTAKDTDEYSVQSLHCIAIFSFYYGLCSKLFHELGNTKAIDFRFEWFESHR